MAPGEVAEKQASCAVSFAATLYFAVGIAHSFGDFGILTYVGAVIHQGFGTGVWNLLGWTLYYPMLYYWAFDLYLVWLRGPHVPLLGSVQWSARARYLPFVGRPWLDFKRGQRCFPAEAILIFFRKSRLNYPPFAVVMAWWVKLLTSVVGIVVSHDVIQTQNVSLAGSNQAPPREEQGGGGTHLVDLSGPRWSHTLFVVSIITLIATITAKLWATRTFFSTDLPQARSVVLAAKLDRVEEGADCSSLKTGGVPAASCTLTEFFIDFCYRQSDEPNRPEQGAAPLLADGRAGQTSPASYGGADSVRA
jgi:hypothetical protein